MNKQRRSTWNKILRLVDLLPGNSHLVVRKHGRAELWEGEKLILSFTSLSEGEKLLIEYLRGERQ